ncbi:MAG: metal ABC transporter substrate-binding protein [Candidatus Accumulibacter sp.]|jgi:zinc transport system substrate-binding protein|nr:metal ABC transporter substrate-binding protein [Accumulibacter sp.]
MLKRHFLLLSLLLLIFAGSTVSVYAKTVKVIAGTSLIEDIVLDLGGDRTEVITIIKGSSCPGHETVKTTDFVFAAQADMILVHSFQQKMPWLTGMLEAMKNRNPRLVVLEPKGSWLIPEIQKNAVLDIAKALFQIFPDDAKLIDERARKRLTQIDAIDMEIRTRLTSVKGKAVAVADMQSEFVAWAGLEVLRTYGRNEDMHTREIAHLVDDLRDRSLAGVVDNYQSGSDAGLPLAMELKIPHVVLSNFPGSSDDAHDYFSLLRHNADQLLKLGE